MQRRIGTCCFWTAQTVCDSGEKEKVVGNAREASILTSQCLECHTKGINSHIGIFKRTFHCSMQNVLG